MKGQEKLGIAWAWVKAIDTVLQTGATGNRHTLMTLKVWFLGACKRLYLAKNEVWMWVCGLLQHLGKV